MLARPPGRKVKGSRNRKRKALTLSPDSELVFDRIDFAVCALSHASKSLHGRLCVEEHVVQPLFDAARELRLQLSSWTANLMELHPYRIEELVNAGPWPRPHAWSSTVLVHQGSAQAYVWCQTFATTMLLERVKLRILDLSISRYLDVKSFQRQHLACMAEIQSMADCLSASVPSILCRFRHKAFSDPQAQLSLVPEDASNIEPSLATLAVWPISIAACLDAPFVTQHLWFRNELVMLGKIVGDGALERAISDDWLKL